VRALAPLADRDFRRYFCGEVVSATGSGLHIVALGWYLLTRTGSATSVALVWTLGLGAGLVGLPLAGPLADRYSRRLLCVAADAERLLLVGLMAALAFAGRPPLVALYALTFLVGIGHSLFWPSITALLQEIIPPDQLTAASGLVEVTFQAGNVAGAALGGPLLVALGLGGALTVDAATYVVSGIALLSLRHRPVRRHGHHASYPALVREGAAYLRRHPAVAGFGTASVIPWVATISLNVVMVAYVLRDLRLGATAYGLSDMTYGAGALCAGVTTAAVVARRGEWPAMWSALGMLVACYGALATAPPHVALLFPLAFVAGYCSSGFRVTTAAALLRIVPNAVMGRTSAAFLLASTVMQIAVTLAIGPVVNAAGPRAGLACLAGVVACGGAVLLAVAPAVRGLESAAADG
jgi:MFS family permease